MCVVSVYLWGQGGLGCWIWFGFRAGQLLGCSDDISTAGNRQEVMPADRIPAEATPEGAKALPNRVWRRPPSIHPPWNTMRSVVIDTRTLCGEYLITRRGVPFYHFF